MIDISAWMDHFSQAVTQQFGQRVWFIGLQGSYARGEATPESDIDTVVILDKLTAEDIRSYHALLDTLPHRELLCGFLSGKQELLRWEAFDLFQFYYDTKPILGSLDCLLPLIDSDAVDRAIRTGACNIYHGCVHNMLYGKSEEHLIGLYKSASFVVQAICFRQTGTYIRRQDALKGLVAPAEQAVLETFLHLKNGGAVAFDEMSEALLTWSGNLIRNM